MTNLILNTILKKFLVVGNPDGYEYSFKVKKKFI